MSSSSSVPKPKWFYERGRSLDEMYAIEVNKFSPGIIRALDFCFRKSVMIRLFSSERE